MKKTLLIIAAVALFSTGCIAQKNNVRKAKNLALAETPDFNAAREAINLALQDEITKDQTETWYIAGLIGYQQNYNELLKLQAGTGGKDNAVRGKAVMESYDYWIHADSLSQIPVYDKKGKAKYDKKTRRQIAEKMVEYYTHYELVNYAIDLFNQKDYATAYEAMVRWVSLPDLEMMQEKRLQEQMVKDTTYYLYKFYAGLAAYNSEQYDKAIPILKDMLHNEEKGLESGQFLYQCYINMADSAAANAVLDQCVTLFPGKAWFIENLINNLVNANKMEEAVSYLDKAIEQDPQIQYFILKGSILNQQERFDEAKDTYEQALQLTDTDAAVYENYGFVYSSIGNKLNDNATYLGAKEYEKAKVEIDKAFSDALPYFEKAYQLAPDNYEYKQNLRRLYFRLNMLEEYNKLAE